MRQSAIIVDLDGTLINSHSVADFLDTTGTVNFDAWIKSTIYSPVNEWCIELVRAMALAGHRIIYLTARNNDEISRSITDKWLKANSPIANYLLYMRNEGDTRPDLIIKEEIYRTYIQPTYDVLLAIDDKSSVINMWRSLDIPALHCADY